MVVTFSFSLLTFAFPCGTIPFEEALCDVSEPLPFLWAEGMSPPAMLPLPIFRTLLKIQQTLTVFICCYKLRQDTLVCCLDNVDRIRYTDNEGSVGGQCAICATLFPCGRLATFIRGSRVWSFIFGVTMVSCRRQAAFFFCDSCISIPSLENFTLCA